MNINGLRMLMDSKDIYTVMERGDKKSCDIYCTIFPEGITVDHELEEIIDAMSEVIYGNQQDIDNANSGMDGFISGCRINSWSCDINIEPFSGDGGDHSAVGSNTFCYGNWKQV